MEIASPGVNGGIVGPPLEEQRRAAQAPEHQPPAAGGAAILIADGLDGIRNLLQAPDGTLSFSNSSQRGASRHLALGQL